MAVVSGIMRLRMKSTLSADLIKFAVVGAVSTAIDYVLLNLCYQVLGFSAFWSVFIGFSISAFNGYFLNNVWTYRHLHQKAQASNLIKYLAIGAVGLGLTEIIVDLAITRGGLDINLGKAIAVVLVFFWNFWANRRFTFRTEPAKD